MNHGWRRLLLEAAICGVIAWMLFPSSAQAYIDPGGGSLIWQVLLAAILTLGYVTRKYWHKLTRRGGTEDSDDEIEEDRQDGSN